MSILFRQLLDPVFHTSTRIKKSFTSKLKVSFALLFVLLLAGNSGYTQQPFRVSGSINGLNNDSVVLYINHYGADGQRLKADTIITVSRAGSFSFLGETHVSQLVWMNFGGIRTRKSTSFFLEPGDISLEGSLEHADRIKVTGTTSNNDMTATRSYTWGIYDRMQQLYQQLRTTAPASEDERRLKKQIGEKQDSIESYELRFIKEHPNSLYAGTLIYVKQDKLPVDILEELYNKLSLEVKNMQLVVPVPAKIKARRSVAVGNPAPAFTAPDTAGRIVSLEKFRGKYVLLEFWANWCVPCRKQSPHLVEMFRKYHAKGFDIIQYSIDEKKDEHKWKQAILADGLERWTHLSDLGGFESKVSRLYGVQPIPDNFLINPDGMIVGRNLQGEALEKKLKALLKTD